MSLFIDSIKGELRFIPIRVTIMETIIESKKDWEKIFPEFSILFLPMLLAINAVVPMLSPTPKAIIIKYIGKIWPIAAKADSEIIWPAKIESTTEYKFWNIVPIEEGKAIFQKSL